MPDKIHYEEISILFVYIITLYLIIIANKKNPFLNYHIRIENK